MTSDVLTAKARVFDQWANSYDWLFTSVFYQAVHQRLLSYITVSGYSPVPVLDIGCGTGKLLNRLAAQFPNVQGTGLDLSTAMLRQARLSNRHRPRLIFVQGASEAMPFTDNQFQSAFSTISFFALSRSATGLSGSQSSIAAGRPILFGRLHNDLGVRNPANLGRDGGTNVFL